METLLVGVLITWRVTSLIKDENGPFDLFARIRQLLGVKYDEYSQPVYNGFFAQLLACFWCTSIWIGVALALLWNVPIEHGLAYSAGAIMISYYVGGYSG